MPVKYHEVDGVWERKWMPQTPGYAGLPSDISMTLLMVGEWKSLRLSADRNAHKSIPLDSIKTWQPNGRKILMETLAI